MAVFKYGEGVTLALKEHLLDATASPSFSDIVNQVNAAWNDGTTISALPADRIHRALPKRMMLDESPDAPLLYLMPQDAIESALRAVGRQTWTGDYEFYLVYIDTHSVEGVLMRRLMRYTQALAEFFRRHSTLGGRVQSCLVRGFVYASIFMEPRSNFGDMTVRLSIKHTEKD